MPEIYILYENPHLLVINKPAGLAVERSPLYKSVESWAWEHARMQRGQTFIGIAHRLDRPVSGALILAKRRSTLKVLNEQFARREVKKTYWAVTGAAPPEINGNLKHWLSKDPGGKKAAVFSQPGQGRAEASLDYRVLAHGGGRWLLEIDLHTGRFHQIRAQLSAAGCPIVGDAKYGSGIPYQPESIALHARRVRFTDPLSGDQLDIVAPLPEDEVWHLGSTI